MWPGWVPWVLLLPCALLLGVRAGDSKGHDDTETREVEVKEVALDSAVDLVEYMGKDHEVILVTTKTKRLYFSDNVGQSWVEITDRIDKDKTSQIRVEKVMVNPADKTVAVLQTQRRKLAAGSSSQQSRWHPYIYITEDSGKSWRRAWGVHHGLHKWISHPVERAWALVSWWSGDCSGDMKAKKTEAKDEEQDEEENKACTHRLMFTKDLGRTFIQLADYVVQFNWGSDKVEQQNRVYFTAYRDKTGDQGKLSLWTQEVDFFYVDISSKGKQKGRAQQSLKFGNKFLISNEFVLVAKVKDQASQKVNLMVSKDGAKTFNSALLPSGLGELEEAWYTILDTSEGSVILHINADEQGAKDTGRVFISDSSGYRFSQSLVNNVRSSHGECEFDKVVSLTGVYMANVVSTGSDKDDQTFKSEKQAAQENQEEEAADGSEVDHKHSRGAGKPLKSSKEERSIRTVISFDKGGAWSYLKPPRVNTEGKPYECDGKDLEQCALHLHGTTSWDHYAPFYSSESCVGIIMGTGNVGPSLRFEPDEISTFLSRDGGLTWMEAHKNAYIYEFGDHGGLIAMADDLQKTALVVFSWNEGQTWYDFTVSETKFEVDNILIEPNVTSTTFLMFGTREDGVGVLYYMKFGTLKFPQCKGVWGADSVSSDYETWSPSDGQSGTEKCMLGQQITYTRRKRTSQCWNGEKFERPVVNKKCECTKVDFACELGFVRKVGSTECTYGGTDLLPQSMVPTVCSRTFQANPYRKVPGDQCEGGWEPTAIDVPCPDDGVKGAGSSKQLFYILIGIGLAYLGYAKYAAGGKAAFGEFEAPKSMFADMSPTTLITIPVIALSWLYGKFCVRNVGFDTFGNLAYGKVQGDDFDLGPMGADNDTSLSDFIAEGELDDHAPRVYDGAAADARPERNQWVSGGVGVAKESVPRLSSPGGGSPPPAQLGQGGDTDLL